MRPGEAAEYAELVELHRDELRAHCTRILRSPHDAEDALQEALLRAWRSFHQFEGRGSVRAWLYRIATNASLDHLKRRPEPATSAEPAGRVELDDQLDRRDSVRRLIETARGLTPRQRAVFLRRDLRGLSARETADSLGISVASANSALQRARAAVRSELGVAGG